MFFVGKGLVCFCVSLDHCGFVLLVSLGLVYSVPSREIGWEERLRNDLFCVEWDVKKPCSIHPSILKKPLITWSLPFLLLHQSTYLNQGKSSTRVTRFVVHHRTMEGSNICPLKLAQTDTSSSLAPVVYHCHHFQHYYTQVIDFILSDSFWWLLIFLSCLRVYHLRFVWVWLVFSVPSREKECQIG